MRVQTGRGTITVIALVSILSISLVVNLPGLAVSPVLADIKNIFPTASQLEIDLLTMIPNILVIPFVLLSGWLSMHTNNVRLVVIGLLIYLASGIIYLLCESMLALILTSCLLGIGAGLVIPLAAGLIADVFSGKYRMHQLGYKSAISNIALVVATFVVGWLSKGGWHLPFVVYLMAIIPLALTPFIKDAVKSTSDDIDAAHPEKSMAKVACPTPQAPATDSFGRITRCSHGFYYGRMFGVLGIYFGITFLTMVVAYNLPYLFKSLGIPDTATSTATALYYLALFGGGLLLAKFIKVLGRLTAAWSFVITGCGLLVMWLVPTLWGICIGTFLAGLGYGVIQPMCYDKATYVVNSPNKATFALAYVLAFNYIGISVAPVLIDALVDIVGWHSSQAPFAICCILTFGVAIVGFCTSNRFAFKINPDYFAKPSAARRID